MKMKKEEHPMRKLKEKMEEIAMRKELRLDRPAAAPVSAASAPIAKPNKKKAQRASPQFCAKCGYDHDMIDELKRENRQVRDENRWLRRQLADYHGHAVLDYMKPLVHPTKWRNHEEECMTSISGHA